MAAGLGEPWCRDGGIPQGCPLSMVFIVALYVPWCRRLESLPDIKPQLHADNLKCSAARPRALFEPAYFTARYVRIVGQDVSPGKCVLLSTSKAVRRAMKLWDSSGEGGFWKVQLDVRDLGGHLHFTYRARAGTLSRRVGKATVGVAAVGALPLGFQVKLGLVRGKYLPDSCARVSRVFTCPLWCSTDARYRRAENCGGPQLQFVDQVETSLFDNRDRYAQCYCASVSCMVGVSWTAEV